MPESQNNQWALSFQISFELICLCFELHSPFVFRPLESLVFVFLFFGFDEDGEKFVFYVRLKIKHRRNEHRIAHAIHIDSHFNFSILFISTFKTRNGWPPESKSLNHRVCDFVVELIFFSDVLCQTSKWRKVLQRFMILQRNPNFHSVFIHQSVIQSASWLCFIEMQLKWKETAFYTVPIERYVH